MFVQNWCYLKKCFALHAGRGKDLREGKQYKVPIDSIVDDVADLEEFGLVNRVPDDLQAPQPSTGWTMFASSEEA